MKKGKRVIALGAVVLLVLMYIITLVVAIVDQSASKIALQICMVATMVVPIMAWAGIWLVGHMSGKKSIADLHILQSEEEHFGK